MGKEKAEIRPPESKEAESSVTDRVRNLPLSDDNFDSFVNETLQQSRVEVERFIGGRLSNFFSEWNKFTHDQSILDTIRGYRIPFKEMPLQIKRPHPIHFSASETAAINSEIEKLLSKGVIVSWNDRDIGFMSNIFTRPKPDGSYRMILNLSRLNECVEYKHFKMDSIKTATRMMTPGCWFASVDIKDAYYSVKINEQDQKFMVFSWQSQLFAYTVFPNGLAPCPREFTRINKPLLHYMRNFGFLSVSYIDDFLLLGEGREDCEANVRCTVNTLRRVGFVIHPEKSVLHPTKRIKFLGFILDSDSMTVSLPQEKANIIIEMCGKLINTPKPIIRDVAKAIGNLVAALPAVKMGPLYFRQIENEKAAALKLSCGNFDSRMELSDRAKSDLKWWLMNVKQTSNPVCHGKPDKIVYADASNLGYGYTCEGVSGGGKWTLDEMDMHINEKEITAVWFALLAMCGNDKNLHIRVFSDNVTCVSYLREFGGSHCLTVNEVARKIWLWAEERNVWISSAHIAGVENVEADRKSRVFDDETEWMLNPTMFNELRQNHFPDLCNCIDMFASRINHQVPSYVSWKPDPGACAVDAFSLNWDDYKCVYLFPPFSIIAMTLQKIRVDKAEAVIIVPNWPTQHWYPMLFPLLVERPRILRMDRLLISPVDQRVHPLKLTLLACRLSGRACGYKASTGELPMSASEDGGNRPLLNMHPIWQNGANFVRGLEQVNFLQINLK